MLLNFWTARGYGKRHLRALLMSMAWSVVSGCGGSSTGSTASLASVDASNRDPFAQPPLSSAPSDAFSEAKAVARQLKYHPGHYIAMNDFDKQSDLITVASKPGVTGISKRYFWRDLEPTQGTYDFSAIDSDLQLLADHGMQLVVMVVDKSFDPDFIPTPDYLSKYLLPIEKGGYVVKRWSPFVIRRLAVLTGALARHLDGNPNFEGIALQETSLGLTGQAVTSSGYTPELYRDALVEILKNTRAGFAKSQVFWYMNLIDGDKGNGYIGEIVSAVIPHAIAMGGPDIIPDARWRLLVYPYYDQFKAKMTLFAAVQYASYDTPHVDTTYPTKYWTMAELFQFAKTRLHVNYLFWTRKPKADFPDSYDWTDALPVIRTNPPPLNPSPFDG